MEVYQEIEISNGMIVSRWK